MVRMLSLVLKFLISYCPGKHLVGVFLGRMTVLSAMRMAGELTAVKSVSIPLPSSEFTFSCGKLSQLPNFQGQDYPAGNHLSKLRTANEVV